MSRQTYDPALVTWQLGDGPIVGLHADALIVDDPGIGAGEMMSEVEYDEEVEGREITLRELDRRRDDVLDTSHVADQVR